MANTIQAVVYTSNAGHDYVTGMNSEVFSQLNAGGTAPKVGGSAYDGTPRLDVLPRNLRPRTVQVDDGAGYTRDVVCLTTDAPLWTGAETSITIEDSDGAAHVCTVIGDRGEKQRRRRP